LVAAAFFFIFCNLFFANYLTTRCLFCGISEQDSCHGMSLLIQAFCAIKQPSKDNSCQSLQFFVCGKVLLQHVSARV